MCSIRITKPQTQPNYDVRLPMSKSIVNRMLVLSPGQVIPMLKCQDTLCDDIDIMVKAMETITDSTQANTPTIIDLNASGTAMRFLTALCTVTKGRWILTGSDRLCDRPIKPLVDALRMAGGNIQYLSKEGFPPLMIICEDRPKGGRVEIDGSESSQYVSALMLVEDRFITPLSIYIKGVPTSVPYIDMTRQLIDNFRQEKSMTIESDWSAAAFWLEIKILIRQFTDFVPDGIRLVGLNFDSLQGDKLAEQLFAEIEHGSGVMTWDFHNCPDLVQPAAVCCGLMGRRFQFCGVKNLRLKETDRLDALKTELKKIGVEVSVDVDSISTKDICNKQAIGCAIDTYNDHRMAMAFAGCALKYGEVVIQEPKVVGKSYPNFWSDLQGAGFRITNC